MGWNASDTRPLSFTDCRVPEENLLGPRGQGFKQFLHILDIGRIGVAAMGVGLAQGALDEALAYAKERRAFGKPISKFQAIQAKLADMSTEIEAARLLVYKAAREKDAGRNFTLTAAQAKLKTGRLAVRCTEEAVQIHGGYGYIEEYPGLPLLSRREDPHDRRGHRRGPADGDRPRAGGIAARTQRSVRGFRETRSASPRGRRPCDRSRLPRRRSRALSARLEHYERYLPVGSPPIVFIAAVDFDRELPQTVVLLRGGHARVHRRSAWSRSGSSYRGWP